MCVHYGNLTTGNINVRLDHQRFVFSNHVTTAAGRVVLGWKAFGARGTFRGSRCRSRSSGDGVLLGDCHVCVLEDMRGRGTGRTDGGAANTDVAGDVRAADGTVAPVVRRGEFGKQWLGRRGVPVSRVCGPSQLVLGVSGQEALVVRGDPGWWSSGGDAWDVGGNARDRWVGAHAEWDVGPSGGAVP